MGDFSIKIEHLDATVRAFDEGAVKQEEETRLTLRAVAERVAEAARGEATLKGDIYHGAGDHGDPTRHDGDLVHKITVRSAGGGGFRLAVVESSRTRTKKYPEGYPYPRRLEYGNGGARAFMAPAAELMTPVANQMFDDMTDHVWESEGF